MSVLGAGEGAPNAIADGAIADDARRALLDAQRQLQEEATRPWPGQLYGRIAAILFVAGVFGCVLNYFFEEPRPGGLYWVIAAAALASAVISYAAPWERFPRAAFHTVFAAAAIEIAAAVLVADMELQILYVYMIVAVAFAFGRREVAVWITITALLLLLPLVQYADDPDGVDQVLRHFSLTLPVVAVVGAVITYLRERREAQQTRMRWFAEETIDTALRIAPERE